uniref:Inter-alpha-trypsin inhibitor heavy chain H2 n=2 Tax=Anthurium amnicola TaxID=1678845 RepID=A0A1D1Z528_9ARAE
MEKSSQTEVGGFLKPQMFSLIIPQVKGGSVLSLEVRWLQRLLYNDGQFSISIPFTFPEFVNPSGKIISKRERIKLNINSGTGKEVLCQMTSHALKEIRRQPGGVSFLYDGEVISWSKLDFKFSYTVYSNDIFGGTLLQSPSMNDPDQREMFCLYLFPGTNQQRKVFRNEVVFVVDISESMRGRPLDSVNNALSAVLSELTPSDSFSIIAFNEETYTFSSSLVLATQETVENAAQWMKKNLVTSGGTNIVKSLNEAVGILANTINSMPHICLITDGAVENERSICSTIRTLVDSRASIAPRISTFGIGSYCNHYFLRMLATIGKGLYDAAFEADSIDIRLQRFFKNISSPILANITVENFDHLDSFEVYPSHIPDLLLGYPLILVGRFHGNLPDSVELKGFLAGMVHFSINLKVQKAKDIPLDKVFAKQQIDLMTSQAWFSKSEQLEQKIIKLSIQSGVASEFTHMVLQKKAENDGPVQEGKKFERQKDSGSKDDKPALVGGITLGFGDVIATAENLPPGFRGVKLPEPNSYKMAVDCCNNLANCCCCMCCIQTCSRLNDQCVIIMTQLCTALSCFACIECCAELCCSGSD